MALLWHFFHAALLGIAKERAFILTNPLFSNRKHHVDSFPATVKSRLQHCFFCTGSFELDSCGISQTTTVKSRLQHCFFCTGSFELDSCGISQTTLCKVFSWIY